MDIEVTFWSFQLQIVYLTYELTQFLQILSQALRHSPTATAFCSAKFDPNFDCFVSRGDFPNNVT